MADKIPESMIVFLLPVVYADAEKAGYDMRYFRRIEPIPNFKAY